MPVLHQEPVSYPAEAFLEPPQLGPQVRPQFLEHSHPGMPEQGKRSRSQAEPRPVPSQREPLTYSRSAYLRSRVYLPLSAYYAR